MSTEATNEQQEPLVASRVREDWDARGSVIGRIEATKATTQLKLSLTCWMQLILVYESRLVSMRYCFPRGID